MKIDSPVTSKDGSSIQYKPNLTRFINATKSDFEKFLKNIGLHDRHGHIKNIVKEMDDT